MSKAILVLIAFCFSLGALYAQGDQKKEHVVKDVVATKIQGERGKDKIKSDVPTTDVAAPTNDGCGGCYDCMLVFDNYTGYWINVYVDGVFKGIIEPYGTGNVRVVADWTSWYCETAGSTLSWEDKGDCSAEWWIKLRE